MARILLISNDEQCREKTGLALDGSGHELFTAEEPSQGEYLAAAARIITDRKPAVVVAGFQAEDAASVKLMQSLDQDPDGPAFIFLLRNEAPSLSEILLALNEGAEAFLDDDFSPQALANYIDRAVKGPGRLGWRRQEGPGGEDSGLEELGALRIKSARFEKLISHLLSTPAASLARKTLVVSDSPFQREFLKKILEEHNFPASVASTYDDGLSLALEERPRIIVSDFELEGRTGLELCRAVKLEHKLIPCYFVICTASRGRVNQVMIPGNGVDDCLLKPSGPSDTIDFVSRVALGLLL